MADEQRLSISFPQVAGSALASVSSAVAMSTLGVAGTLIGAALGSVVITVGTVTYRHYLERSRELARTRILQVKLPPPTDSPSETAPEGGSDAPTQALAEASAELSPDDESGEQHAPGRSGPLDRLSGIPRRTWLRAGLAVAGVFVFAMAAITTFELATGRALSATVTGDDSLDSRPSIAGGAPVGTSSPTPDDEDKSPAPAPSSSATDVGPTTGPTGEPTEPAESDEPDDPGEPAPSTSSRAPTTPPPTTAPTAPTTPPTGSTPTQAD